MALGTPTLVTPESTKGDALFVDQMSFAGDDSYPTGGTLDFDALVKTALGDARNVVAVISGACGDNYAVYVPDAGATPGKLQVFVRSTGAEVGNSVNLSGVTFNVVVISK